MIVDLSTHPDTLLTEISVMVVDTSDQAHGEHGDLLGVGDLREELHRVGVIIVSKVDYSRVSNLEIVPQKVKIF